MDAMVLPALILLKKTDELFQPNEGKNEVLDRFFSRARLVSFALLLRLLALTRLMAHQFPSPYALTFQPIPPGKDRIETLDQGKPAPFLRQLIELETALRWANHLRQIRKKS